MSLKNPSDRLGFRDDLDARDVLDSFSRRRPKKSGRRRKILGPVLVVCAIVAMLAAVDYWSNAGKIYRGVSIGDVSLSGMTREEARKAIEDRTTNGLTAIKLTGGPEETTISAQEMGVDFDVWATVERAYAVGRQGGITERIGDRLKGSWGTVNVSPVVDYKREVAQRRVENLAARINQEPSDALVKVNGSDAQAVESREGYGVDVPATVENVKGAINDLSGEAKIAGSVLEPEVSTPAAQSAAEKAKALMSDKPISLSAEDKDWKLSPAQIGKTLSFTPQNGELQVGLDQEQLRSALSDMYDTLTTDPVEAGFKLQDGKVQVTKSQTGHTVDDKKLLSDLESGLSNGQREFKVPVFSEEPNLTTDKAQELKPSELLGSYRTNYTLTSDKSPERVENLDIASNAISGQIVAPGEVFSVNEIASPLSYNKTHVIILGKEETADGGGLCQVASTLYNAANYAGLEIVERHPHDAQLPYIRPGLDATVWFGALDMKFKNVTDGYLLLREYVADDGYIYAEIYGQPTGKKVETDSEPEYMGSDSSVWVTYQKVTDEKGKVIFDDVIHKDTYKPLIDEKGETIAPNDPYLNVAPVNY